MYVNDKTENISVSALFLLGNPSLLRLYLKQYTLIFCSISRLDDHADATEKRSRSFYVNICASVWKSLCQTHAKIVASISIFVLVLVKELWKYLLIFQLKFSNKCAVTQRVILLVLRSKLPYFQTKRFRFLPLSI